METETQVQPIIDPLIVIKRIADYYHRPIEDIILTRQFRRDVTVRQQAAYFLKNYTNLTLNEIGSYFFGRKGPKDHATILHAIKAVQNDMDTNFQYKCDIEYIDRLIRDSLKLDEYRSSPGENEIKLIKKIHVLQNKNYKLKDTVKKLHSLIYRLEASHKKSKTDFNPKIDVQCNCMRILGNQTLN